MSAVFWVMRQAAGSALGNRCDTHSRSLISSSSLSSIFSLSQSSMAKLPQTWYRPSPCMHTRSFQGAGTRKVSLIRAASPQASPNHARTSQTALKACESLHDDPLDQPLLKLTRGFMAAMHASHGMPDAVHTSDQQGMEQMRPSLMPYRFPSVHTADEKQSPSGVGSTRLFTASAIATALEAAGDCFILLAISPPAARKSQNTASTSFVRLPAWQQSLFSLICFFQTPTRCPLRDLGSSGKGIRPERQERWAVLTSSSHCGREVVPKPVLLLDDIQSRLSRYAGI